MFDEAVRVIGVAICGWTGLPLTAQNARRRVWDLERIVDGFGGMEPDRFAFVPQGGGDPAAGHRCAGERVAVELLKGAVRALASLRYGVPDQDLRYPLTRIPTRPRSGFIITNIHPT